MNWSEVTFNFSEANINNWNRFRGEAVKIRSLIYISHLQYAFRIFAQYHRRNYTIR